MDFGKILDKWESGKPRTSRKSVMETWLKNNGVPDKDADEKETFAPGEKRALLSRKKPDDIIDIHGLTGEKARISLENFFSNAKSRGFNKLRIIHGKGNHSKGEAVLKTTVKNFIEQCGFAGESGYENSANGGTGATWVLLKD